MMTKRSMGIVALGCLTLGATANLNAQTLVSADFSTYSDGALVGQNGWDRYAANTDRPLTVASGAVTWVGGNATDGQDAALGFAEQIAQPLSGTTLLNYDLVLSVSAAGANPAYFAALNTLTVTNTSGNFQNARLVARSEGAGFVFGTRVNGQGGYPFVYGTNELTFGVSYALRAEISMVAGNANDFISLYVGPDFDNLSLQAIAAYTSGSVTDPLYGGMLLSQFGSGSINEAGISVQEMSVTMVPEPSTYALLAGGALMMGAGWLRRRPIAG
jgi:hypothetical protein